MKPDDGPGKKAEKKRSDEDKAFNMMIEELQQAIIQKEEEIYSERVLSEARNPQNMGALDDPDAVGGITGSCGDTITFDVKVKDGVIKDIRFRTDGCGSTVACASMLTKMVLGLIIEKAGAITEEELEEVLGGLPEENKHCSLLAVRSLRATLDRLPGKKD